MKLIRVLVYEGDEKWLLDQMERNGVKGEYILRSGCYIREIYVGRSLRALLEALGKEDEQ